jgi:hypothetical protein
MEVQSCLVSCRIHHLELSFQCYAYRTHEPLLRNSPAVMLAIRIFGKY